MKYTKKVWIRKTPLGRHSEGWRIWNITHPEDPILPGTGYVIHHKDHNHSNNATDNLQKMTDSEHRIHHSRKGIPRSEETKRKISIANLGMKHSEETRRRMSLGQLGRKHSMETRKKMSIAKLGKKRGPMPDELQDLQ